MSRCITVFGKVRGKARPRFTRAGRAYTPRQTVEYERLIRSVWLEKYPVGRCEPFSGPVSVKVSVYRALPKSMAKKGAEPDVHKPDADNVLKIVMDALNGVAYGDDCQVVKAEIEKMPRSVREEHMSVEVAGC